VRRPWRAPVCGRFRRPSYIACCQSRTGESVAVNVRFHAQDIGDPLALVPDRVARLADRVQELHAQEPLIPREVDLARKLVNMSDQGTEDLSGPWRGVGAHGVDDHRRQVGVVTTSHGGHLGGDVVDC
jgi:hypothetical protein